MAFENYIVGLGSNVGDRFGYLRAAIAQLVAESGIELRCVSPIYETKPLGGPAGQGNYLNTVAALDTSFSPAELLSLLQAVEERMGRVRSVRWGAREIDLDLLVAGDTVIETVKLQVPHPRLHERWFVLRPLVDIAPELIHPVKQESMSFLLGALEGLDPSQIGAKVADAGWASPGGRVAAP